MAGDHGLDQMVGVTLGLHGVEGQVGDQGIGAPEGHHGFCLGGKGDQVAGGQFLVDQIGGENSRPPADIQHLNPIIGRDTGFVEGAADDSRAFPYFELGRVAPCGRISRSPVGPGWQEKASYQDHQADGHHGDGHADESRIEHADGSDDRQAGGVSFHGVKHHAGDDQVRGGADDGAHAAQDGGEAQGQVQLLGGEPGHAGDVTDHRNHHGHEWRVVEKGAAEGDGRQNAYLGADNALGNAHEPVHDHGDGTGGVHAGGHHEENAHGEHAGIAESFEQLRWRGQVEGHGHGQGPQKNSGCRNAGLDQQNEKDDQKGQGQVGGNGHGKPPLARRGDGFPPGRAKSRYEKSRQ
ncbi:hypothetical protein DESC_40007 [Desulfosarcina cetonica]|nr:hypothetical protein DESC_40007 [Desulfosarcina cetonica]